MEHPGIPGPRPAVLAALVVAVVGVLTFPGCDRFAARSPLVVAYDDLPVTLDPHFHNETIVWSVLCNFYDALVTLTPEMRLEPSLAVSWRQSSPTLWRLALRDGVRFSNGDLFTAADVVASFERARSHPRSAIRHHFVGVRQMRAEGELSLVVETEAPAPDLINRLAFLFVVPRGDAGDAEITRPVGTGPYRFLDRASDGNIRAEGWGSWRGVPRIRRVVMMFFHGATETSLKLLMDGAVDVMTTIEDDQLQRVEGGKGVRLVPQPRLAVQLLSIAPRAARGPAAQALADRRVRRALLLALNRPAWVSRLFRGNATVASQYVHPVVLGYDPALQPEPWDPEEAKRLLREAGFGDGFAITLACGQGAVPGLTDAIVDDLARVGVRTTIHEGSFGELVRAARAGEVSLLYFAWSCSTGDASDFLNTFAHTRDPRKGLGEENYAGFSNRRVDALLDEAEVEMAPARRVELLQRAQRLVLDELPVLPLTIRWGYAGVSDRVEIVTRHDRRLWLAACRWRT